MEDSNHYRADVHGSRGAVAHNSGASAPVHLCSSTLAALVLGLLCTAWCDHLVDQPRHEHEYSEHNRDPQ